MENAGGSDFTAYLSWPTPFCETQWPKATGQLEIWKQASGTQWGPRWVSGEANADLWLPQASQLLAPMTGLGHQVSETYWVPHTGILRTCSMLFFSLPRRPASQLSQAGVDQSPPCADDITPNTFRLSPSKARGLCLSIYCSFSTAFHGVCHTAGTREKRER